MRRFATTLLLASAGMLFGQDNPFWQPEVRRAVPVEKATPTPMPEPSPAQREIPTAPAVPFDNPAWMQKVPQPKTPAPPVAEPVGPEPGFTPYRPQGRIEVAPTAPPAPAAAPVATPADENGDIRLSPASVTPEAAAAAELDLANSLYARKMYDYAVTEYEKFLIAHPSAKGRDMALFRLAECHRMLDHGEAARNGYERLLMEFHEGEFAGSAAYRLGEFLYGEKKYDPAATQFELAASQAASDEVRLSSRYNLARCYDRLNRPADAQKAYAAVAAVEKNNPYRDYARLSLAQADASAGRKTEALEKFGKIASGSGPSALRAEAAVKAASLAVELGDKKQAIKLFNDAMGNSDSGEWKSVAFLGAMRLNYDLGNYKKVTDMSDNPPKDLPDEARAEVLLLGANSYRQTGNIRAARALYDRLLIQFPDSAPSKDARFDRLLSMYQLNDPGLLAETDKFLSEATNPKEIAQVTLLKAEALFKDKKYAEAGPLYARLLVAELSDDLKNKALYKLGWCQAQSGDPAGAIQTFTEYLQKNPKGDNASAALLQRGLALQANKDYPAAIKDFDTLIARDKSSERELALQQKALILGQQEDYKGMIAAFREFLADYPRSSGAGQANFWIGWAAFEDKNYKAALENLELARKLDPSQYGERAVLRIILCYYYLENRPALVRTIAENKSVAVPVEITRWLGRKSFEEGDYAAAEQYLLPVIKDEKAAEPEVLIELAEAQIRQGRVAEAGPIVAKYLQTARDPRSRARGLQAQAAVAIASRDFDAAAKLCDESLLLQPEGQLNAEGRLLTGEIAFAKGDYSEAARAFMTVAVLYDDPALTPRALRRAATAYRKADNTLEADKALQELQHRFPDFEKSAKVSKGD
jgi:TolA-binding protein